MTVEKAGTIVNLQDEGVRKRFEGPKERHLAQMLARQSHIKQGKQ